MSHPPPALNERHAAELNLASLERRGCSRQWRPFVAALTRELLAAARPDEASAFLRHVGRRMAALLPLPPVDTLQELEAAINAVWRDIDWGWTRLVVLDDAIRIVHGAYPDATAGPGDTAWTDAAAALLEGVYDVWLKAQGSPLRRTERVSGGKDVLEFRHGQ